MAGQSSRSHALIISAGGSRSETYSETRPKTTVQKCGLNEHAEQSAWSEGGCDAAGVGVDAEAHLGPWTAGGVHRRLHRKPPGMQEAGGGREALGAEAEGRSRADCATGTSLLVQMLVLILSSVLWTNKSDAELNGPLQGNAPPSWPRPLPTAPSPKPLPHTLQALFHPLNALCSVRRYLKSPNAITLAPLRRFLFAPSFHSPVALFRQVDYKILR